jgi:hypothetical protein
MRAETELRIRVSKTLKTEWKARARADGVSLSHVLRTAGRFAMLLGPGHLQDAVAHVSAIRRELHAANTELSRIAVEGSRIDPAELRAAVARTHEAADATTVFLRRR